jgi:hypothetical protein
MVLKNSLIHVVANESKNISTNDAIGFVNVVTTTAEVFCLVFIV